MLSEGKEQIILGAWLSFKIPPSRDFKHLKLMHTF